MIFMVIEDNKKDKWIFAIDDISAVMPSVDKIRIFTKSDPSTPFIVDVSMDELIKQMKEQEIAVRNQEMDRRSQL